MGTMTTVELVMHRRNLTAFIQSDYAMISFNREQNQSDQEGGRVRNVPTIIPPQKVRVIPARSKSSSMIYTSPTGQIQSSKDSLLIGAWNLDVQLKDWFEYEADAFQISFIRPERSVETICQLDLLGPNWRSTV